MHLEAGSYKNIVQYFNVVYNKGSKISSGQGESPYRR